MPLNMRIESTNVTSVPEDVATELAEAYAALKPLPSTRMLTTDPFTSEGYDGPNKIDGKDVTEEYKAATMARKFVRQGKAWAESQTGDNDRPLMFVRKGDVKGNPTVVSFRIYEQKTQKEQTKSE